MDAAGELACKQLIDHTVAFEAALSLEGFRHDIDAVMCLPARLVSGMAFMLVGFVQHLEAFRCESLGQLLCDEIGGPHAARLGEDSPLVNGWHCSRRYKQVLKASLAKAHNDRS